MKIVPFKELIIYEDDDYVVINKPPHIATLNDRVATQNIISMAKEYTADAQVCHRLDKETSGALAIAKNPEAYRSLSIQFEKREVDKVYHAVIKGLKDFGEVKVELPISQLSNGTVKIDKKEGKLAETFFSSLKTFRNYTLVACKPVTGRMHQIRIHLASLGSPIACDENYGGEYIYMSSLKRNFKLKKDTEELPLISRVALHAYSLAFNNMGGKKVNIIAPYPKDFDVLIKQLEKNNL